MKKGSNEDSVKEMNQKQLLGIKSYLKSKLSFIAGIVDYAGNIKFYIIKTNRRTFKIGKSSYFILEDEIKKTNTKFPIIFYYQDNPEGFSLLHRSSSKLSGEQLTDFLDCEVFGKIMRGVKKKNGFSFIHILMLIGIAFIGGLILLNLFGVIDIGKFFLGGG